MGANNKTSVTLSSILLEKILIATPFFRRPDQNRVHYIYSATFSELFKTHNNTWRIGNYCHYHNNNNKNNKNNNNTNNNNNNTKITLPSITSQLI